MAVLEILEYPDPRLRKKAVPVTAFGDRIEQIVKDMFETMYAAPGVGLAATQVDIHEQVIVIDVSENQDQPMVFINPKITILDETLFDYSEGCLSVPSFYEKISRPKHIRVSALNEQGKPFTLEPEGLLAVCIQHEQDHLEGKLFVDYLSNFKRKRIRSKLEKAHKAQR